jgi:hypothetical protein
MRNPASRVMLQVNEVKHLGSLPQYFGENENLRLRLQNDTVAVAKAVFVCGPIIRQTRRLQ